ncbi:LysR substrate-binding domain-containing protein [Rhizorhabdus wittichii]|nr:LysR substrate-binding domain-containing protein [Rhizorhabdus wittichii]
MQDFRTTMSRLTMRHLRIVLAITDGGSLVAAAHTLCMTQPAITKALQETEALLQIELFSRTNRGVVPTPAGQALAAHARLITAQIGHAAEEIHDLRDGMGGRIAVGTLLSASADLLPRAIAMLRRDRPKLVVTIVEGTNDRLLPDLRLGKLDMVVGRLPEYHELQGLHQEVLLTDVSCVIVRPGHPLVGRDPLRLADLAGWDWILPRLETTLRRHIDQAFRDEGVEPPPHAVESVSQLTNRSLVMDADYLGILPWQLAHREARAGHLVILPLLLRPTIGPVGISTRAECRLSSAAEMLIAAMRDFARQAEPSPLLAGITERATAAGPRRPGPDSVAMSGMPGGAARDREGWRRDYQMT